MALTGGLTGCSDSDLPGDGSGGTSDGVTGLPESVRSTLSLSEVGDEEVTVGDGSGRLVAYRRDREPSTAVEQFAAGVDAETKPVGRNVSATEFGVEAVEFPAEDSPSVPPEYAGLFVPAGARAKPQNDPRVQSEEMLAVLAGSELPAEVTVGNDNTRMFTGPEVMPGTDWFPGPTWVPGSMWVPDSMWMPGSMWVPDSMWSPGNDWASGDARVLVSAGDRSLDEFGLPAEAAGEPVESGQTVASENTLFVTSVARSTGGQAPFTVADVFDAGPPAEMGGAGAGVALLSTSGGGALSAMEPGDLLTSAAGKRAMAMTGATDADEVEWLAGPTRLDGTDHFTPEPGAYTGEFLGGSDEIATFGGIVAGEQGPWAVVAHATHPGEPHIWLFDGTPVGSTTPFEEEAFDRLFPSARLHRSRGLLWVAAGGDVEAGGAATGSPTAEGSVTLVTPGGETLRVEPVESDQSIEEYYGYDTDTQNSSALPDGIEVPDATVTFVYHDTSTDTRSLVVVHDSPDGGTGGDAAMTFEGVEDTEWQVKDDPEPRSASERYETPGETDDGAVSVIWGWSGGSSLTDGGALGPLADRYAVTITHHEEATVEDRTTQRSGIDRWLFVDGRDPDSPIELADFADGGDATVAVGDAT